MRSNSPLALFGALVVATASAQEVEIVSFHANGELTWTNANTGVVCHVEWSPSLANGQWSRTWTNLADITITNFTTTVQVPMFYRVVCVTGMPTVVTIAVQNASFELPDVSGFSCADPTGWDATGGACLQGINDEDTGMFAAPDGEQVAYVNTGTSLSHTLTNTLSVGTQYDLTVAIGTRSDVGGSYDVRLMAGGDILSSTNGALTAGTAFQDVTVSYTAPASHAQLGEPLVIYLTGSTQPQYDHIRLTAQAAP